MTGTYKVLNATKTPKGVKVHLAPTDGSGKTPLSAFAATKYGFSIDDFTIGDEQPAVLEWNQDSSWTDGGWWFLASWGEKEKKKDMAWQPKPPADIAVMAVCNVNTTAVAAVNQLVAFGVVKDLEAYTTALNGLYGVILGEAVKAMKDLKAVCE